MTNADTLPLDKLPIHFDCCGPLTTVLNEIADHIPSFFPAHPELAPNLQQLIKRYAIENHWNSIAVSVSQNMARQVLNELTENDFLHKGSIIIDPTAKTPEHHVLTNCTQIRVNRERMTKVNEATEDLLIVVYGFDQIDRAEAWHLLMRRLRMFDQTLELLDEDASQDGVLSDTRLRAQRLRRLKLAREQLGVLLHDMSLPEAISEAEFHEKFGGQILLLYATLYRMAHDPNNQNTQHLFHTLMHQIHMLPRHFPTVNLDFNEHDDIMLSLRGGGTPRAVAAPEPHERHTQHYAKPEPQPE